MGSKNGKKSASITQQKGESDRTSATTSLEPISFSDFCNLCSGSYPKPPIEERDKAATKIFSMGIHEDTPERPLIPQTFLCVVACHSCRNKWGDPEFVVVDKNHELWIKFSNHIEPVKFPFSAVP